MQSQAVSPVTHFADRFWSYLPTLAGGLFVLGVGVLLGWVAKRAVVRVLVWLRLDRLGGRVGWRTAFAKGDVRAALYDLVGGLAMTVVVLVFLDNAFQIWGLAVLSRMIDGAVVYLPNLGIVALIVVVGLLLSNIVSQRAAAALEEEGFEHATLAARILKGVLLSLVGALALWQLSFARQIILGAFLIGFAAVGLAFALSVGIGGARAIQSGMQDLFRKDDGK
jgi:Mechanosensitive ion channel, conserved TM helix